jgi:anti-sigma factor RsiW
MAELAVNNRNCRSAEVAAYLDGELGAGALLAFEEHLKECRSCAAKLEEQRRLLCTLDMAFNEERQLALPADFTRVVTAHAQTDMSGVRAKRERARALRLSAALALFSFALLGGAALSDSVFEPVRMFGRLSGAGLGILWRALYDAGATFAVIMRIVGRFAFESHPLGLFSYLVLCAALLLLLRLIRGYHRARPAD